VSDSAPDNYVRTYNPSTDAEEWIGPLSSSLAALVAESLPLQTRVYRSSELPEERQ